MAASGAVAKSRAAPWLRKYVVVYCDPTLKPVLRAAAAGFGAPVILFAAPPALSIGLLAHGTQDDLLITTPAMAAQAASAGVLAGGDTPPRWRNHLVLAGLRGQGGRLAGLDAAAVLARLGDGRFALSDASPAATIDGPAVIDALGLTGALAGRTVPAVDTGEVGPLLRSGAARIGLCHRTDVRADDGIEEIAALPDASYPPIAYCVRRTRHAWSMNMDAFETYLASPDGAARLGRLGLVPA